MRRRHGDETATALCDALGYGIDIDGRFAAVSLDGVDDGKPVDQRRQHVGFEGGEEHLGVIAKSDGAYSAKGY